MTYGIGYDLKIRNILTMAILPSWPGIKLPVFCDGAALQEFDGKDARPPSVVVA